MGKHISCNIARGQQFMRKHISCKGSSIIVIIFTSVRWGGEGGSRATVRFFKCRFLNVLMEIRK